MSQQREFGGPVEAAEQGDALRAPGGTVVTAIVDCGGAPPDDGGDGGVIDTELCTEKEENTD